MYDKFVIKVNEDDNVATSICNLDKGEVIGVYELQSSDFVGEVKLKTSVPKYYKVALKEIKAVPSELVERLRKYPKDSRDKVISEVGESIVVKFGEPIGFIINCDVEVGEVVNLSYLLLDEELASKLYEFYEESYERSIISPRRVTVGSIGRAVRDLNINLRAIQLRGLDLPILRRVYLTPDPLLSRVFPRCNVIGKLLTSLRRGTDVIIGNLADLDWFFVVREKGMERKDVIRNYYSLLKRYMDVSIELM